MMTQRSATSLLPFKYIQNVANNNGRINLVSKRHGDIIVKEVPAKEVLKTPYNEVVLESRLEEDSSFLNFPAVDIQLMDKDKTTTQIFESKLCHYDNKQFEIILRQDFFSANLLRNIITRNPSIKKLDNATVETPIVLCLLWQIHDNSVHFDMLAFTDLAILQMIWNSDSPRSEASRELIRKAFDGYTAKKCIEYKVKRTDTVPHQKISFHPLRTYECIKNCKLSFTVTDKELDIGEVKPDKNLWHIMEINRKKRKIEELQEKIQY